MSARSEIMSFVESDAPGIESNLKADALKRAAETIYTANGLNCPISIVSKNGKVFIIKRDAIK